MKSRIHYTKPSITSLELEYVADAAANGWGEKCYEYITEFENKFKQYLGVEYAIATSSCTGALHMGMAALGIGFGDEVILADANWIATASPIVQLGAKPVFVDILPDTWCINPDLVEKAITPKTKAIVAVHLYGNLCNMEALMAIGEKHGIPIIEDAAEAIGSVYRGNCAGSMGKFGAFSFHGTKTLTTGEGGMFVTNDADFYERVLTLSNHGRSRNQVKQFWPDLVGFKYKMSNLQAALGCAQMTRVADLVGRKREIFNYYHQNLISMPWLSMNHVDEGDINGFWMPTVVFSKGSNVTREILQDLFFDENIDARVFFWPLSSLEFFKPYSFNSNPIAIDIASRSINLPSFHDITADEQNRVISVFQNICKGLYA